MESLALCHWSVMSAQLVHTWAVASQSSLHWSTYWPGARLGTSTESTTATLPHLLGMFPEHSPGLPV